MTHKESIWDGSIDKEPRESVRRVPFSCPAYLSVALALTLATPLPAFPRAINSLPEAIYRLRGRRSLDRPGKSALDACRFRDDDSPALHVAIVQHVLAMRARFQVIRVNACANVAQVHDVQPGGNRTKCKLVRNTVRSPHATSKPYGSILARE
jgi:hypothetical protein